MASQREKLEELLATGGVRENRELYPQGKAILPTTVSDNGVGKAWRGTEKENKGKDKAASAKLTPIGFGDFKDAPGPAVRRREGKSSVGNACGHKAVSVTSNMACVRQSKRYSADRRL